MFKSTWLLRLPYTLLTGNMSECQDDKLVLLPQVCSISADLSPGEWENFQDSNVYDA